MLWNLVLWGWNLIFFIFFHPEYLYTIPGRQTALQAFYSAHSVLPGITSEEPYNFQQDPIPLLQYARECIHSVPNSQKVQTSPYCAKKPWSLEIQRMVRLAFPKLSRRSRTFHGPWARSLRRASALEAAIKVIAQRRRKKRTAPTSTFWELSWVSNKKRQLEMATEG